MRLALGTVLVLVGACGGCSDPESSSGADGSSAGGAAGATVGNGGASGSVAGAASSSGGSSTQVAQDELLRAAVVTGSCIADDGINRHLARFRERAWYPGSLAFPQSSIQCLAAAATGCGAVESCLGYVMSLGADPTCEAGCAGSVMTYCADEASLAWDCAQVGLQCHSEAGCVESTTLEACSEDTDVPSCTAEGRAQSCVGGFVRQGADCVALGLGCEAGECVGLGAECSESSLGAAINGIPEYAGIECDGSLLRSCVGGHLHERDCSELGAGFSCQVIEVDPSCAGTGCGPLVFCGLGNECAPGEQPPGFGGTAEDCDGNSVRFCNAGRLETMDCLSLGFDGCDVSAGNFGCVSSE